MSSSSCSSSSSVTTSSSFTSWTDCGTSKSSRRSCRYDSCISNSFTSGKKRKNFSGARKTHNFEYSRSQGPWNDFKSVGWRNSLNNKDDIYTQRNVSNIRKNTTKNYHMPKLSADVWNIWTSPNVRSMTESHSSIGMDGVRTHQRQKRGRKMKVMEKQRGKNERKLYKTKTSTIPKQDTATKKIREKRIEKKVNKPGYLRRVHEAPISSTSPMNEEYVRKTIKKFCKFLRLHPSKPTLSAQRLKVEEYKNWDRLRRKHLHKYESSRDSFSASLDELMQERCQINRKKENTLKKRASVEAGQSKAQKIVGAYETFQRGFGPSQRGRDAYNNDKRNKRNMNAATSISHDLYANRKSKGYIKNESSLSLRVKDKSRNIILPYLKISTNETVFSGEKNDPIACGTCTHDMNTECQLQAAYQNNVNMCSKIPSSYKFKSDYILPLLANRENLYSELDENVIIVCNRKSVLKYQLTFRDASCQTDDIELMRTEPSPHCTDLRPKKHITIQAEPIIINDDVLKERKNNTITRQNLARSNKDKSKLERFFSKTFDTTKMPTRYTLNIKRVGLQRQLSTQRKNSYKRLGAGLPQTTKSSSNC